MIIDIHAHITYARFPQFARKLIKRPGFPVTVLLKRMDLEGIDQSVVLPLGNPENMDIYGVAGNLECLEACRRHRDRLIPFCNIDPRNMLNTPKADLSALLQVYKDLGCRGIGEICANLPILHPLYQNLFRHAERQRMPMVFHFSAQSGGTYGVIDRLGLPGLRASLRKFPKAMFIGHAPAFWNEIDGNLGSAERDSYVKGPIRRRGRLWEIFARHPNVYGDLSAGSAHNAISRDPAVGYAFLQKFHRKLFFGTDRFTSKDEPIPPILTFLKDAVRTKKITRPAYEAIMARNFQRLIGVS